MVLEMQAAKIDSRLKQTVSKLDLEKVKLNVINKQEKRLEEIKDNDIEIKLTKEKVSTIEKHELTVNCEEKVSTLQVVRDALEKDTEILNKMQRLIEESNFENIEHSEKVEIQEKLISYIDDINKISINTKFNDKELLSGSYESNNDNNEIAFERIDSQTLGLSVDNISRLTLDSVRVAGESYMPPYSFDVTNAAGAGAALSIIGSAISKIDSYKRQVIIDMNTLTRYPEILEFDRSTYNEEQIKIRYADSARRMVAKIQNSIRFQISKVQRSQTVKASAGIINLFMNG